MRVVTLKCTSSWEIIYFYEIIVVFIVKT